MEKIKTNFGASILIVSVALLVALPVRVYQYLHVIDGTTGFYNNWLNPTVFGLYGLCALVVIALILLSLKGGKKTVYAMPAGKKTGLAVASLALSLAFLVQSAFDALKAYRIITGYTPVEQLVLGNRAGKPTLAFTALQVVFGILSAVFFLAFSAGFFTGKESYRKLKILAAEPAVWGVARLMNGFTQTISYRYVSELLFELLMIVFLCMFFVAFAKFCIGTLQYRVQMRLFAYGLLGFFFALLSAVPRYIIVLMGRQDVLYRSESIFAAVDLIVPIFIACFIFSVASLKQYKAVKEYGKSEEEISE